MLAQDIANIKQEIRKVFKMSAQASWLKHVKLNDT